MTRLILWIKEAVEGWAYLFSKANCNHAPDFDKGFDAFTNITCVHCGKVLHKARPRK